MTDRETILSGLVDEPVPLVRNAVAATAFEVDLWRAFERHLLLLGGRLINDSEFVRLRAHPTWADPALAIPNTVGEVWEAEIGFSLAWRAVAQTGSLVLVTGGTEAYRLSSLVPPINVIVVDRAAIVATLDEALRELPSVNVVLVTGPSRTADIEGVLVRGVHGPGEVLVYVRDQ